MGSTHATYSADAVAPIPAVVPVARERHGPEWLGHSEIIQAWLRGVLPACCCCGSTSNARTWSFSWGAMVVFNAPMVTKARERHRPGHWLNGGRCRGGAGVVPARHRVRAVVHVLFARHAGLFISNDFRYSL
jgi:hypothetical protein